MFLTILTHPGCCTINTTSVWCQLDDTSKTSFATAKGATSSYWNFKKKTTSPDSQLYLGVSKNRGTPKWMVYNGKPYWNGWFGGFLKSKHLKQIAWLTESATATAGAPLVTDSSAWCSEESLESKLAKFRNMKLTVGSKVQMAPFICSVYPSKFFQNPIVHVFLLVFREKKHEFKLGTGLSRMRMGRYFRSLGLHLDISNPESNIL